MKSHLLLRLLLLPLVLCQFLVSPRAATPLADSEQTFAANGNRILFLGDSITQAGLYVSLIETYLWARYPDREVTIVNMGVSAETVSNTTEPNHNPRPWVHHRVEQAMEIAKPNWVFICYGMNDGNYYPPRRDIQDAYLHQLDRLLDRIAPSGAKVVLLSPPPFDPTSKPTQNLLPPGEEIYGYHLTYQHYDDTLSNLAGLALGAFSGRIHQFIDIHTPLKNYITLARQDDPDYKYGDGVHPPSDGHMAFALAILEALGENQDEAYNLLRNLVGIRLKTDPREETATEHQIKLRADLAHRFDTLSKIYRDNTRPETRSMPPNLPSAIQAATRQANRLRKTIKEKTDAPTQ